MPILFAADDPSFWSSSVGFCIVLFGLLTAIVGWLTARINSNTKLQVQISELQVKAYECLEREALQKIEIAELKHELKGYLARIDRLEKLAGVSRLDAAIPKQVKDIG